jgi:hypothetical protein
LPELHQKHFHDAWLVKHGDEHLITLSQKHEIFPDCHFLELRAGLQIFALTGHDFIEGVSVKSPEHVVGAQGHETHADGLDLLNLVTNSYRIVSVNFEKILEPQAFLVLQMHLGFAGIHVIRVLLHHFAQTADIARRLEDKFCADTARNLGPNFLQNIGIHLHLLLFSDHGRILIDLKVLV